MSFAFPFKASLILKQSLLPLSHRKKLPDIFGVYILRHLLGVSRCLVFDGRPVHGFGDGVRVVDFEHFECRCLFFVLFDIRMVVITVNVFKGLVLFHFLGGEVLGESRVGVVLDERSKTINETTAVMVLTKDLTFLSIVSVVVGGEGE